MNYLPLSAIAHMIPRLCKPANFDACPTDLCHNCKFYSMDRTNTTSCSVAVTFGLRNMSDCFSKFEAIRYHYQLHENYPEYFL